MKPEDVISWKSELIDGVNTLVEVRLQEIISESHGYQVRVARPNSYEIWRQNGIGEWCLHSTLEMLPETWERLTADIWSLWPHTKAELDRIPFGVYGCSQ